MKAETMRRIRQIHNYVGLFFAPAIIFFAVSGAFQTIGLHEAESYGGTPPGWIVWMASVHQHQALPGEGAAMADDDHPPAAQAAGEALGKSAARPRFLPLKAFVLLLAIGLILSSSLGVAIALSSRATRRISAVVLASGAVLPLLLLLL